MLRRQLGSMLCALVFATAAALALQTPAPDLSGTWTGTMVNNADANDRDGARLVLKHSGATLTGTAGPNAEQQFEVSNAKVATTKDGTTVTFAVANDNFTIHFDLKLVDGHLKGSVRSERGTESRTGTVDFERAK